MSKSIYDLRDLVTRLSRLTIATTLLSCATFAQADDDPSPIDRIEEDWEMSIVDPAPEDNSPQVTFFVKPSPQVGTSYFQIQMNYAAKESYSAGGFHVAAIADESHVDEARSGTRQGLSISNDTIRWTNVMVIMDNKLFFAIKNGHCTDWGTFGGPEYLVQMPAGSTSSLDDYHPKHSLEDVDIGYGGNRVSAIELKTVRAYYRDGTMVSVPVNRFVQR